MGRPVNLDVQKKNQAQEVRDDKMKEAKSGRIDCFNCSESGHYSSDCPKAKCCHICRSEAHEAAKCPEWKKLREAAEYYGSANSGLGFFRIDIEDRVDRHRSWV